MWKRSENGTTEKPAALEIDTSKRWNYVRRNFVLVEAAEDRPAHWEWEEKKVLKEDWETYMQVADHSDALEDVYAALTELAEIITEV